MDSNLLTPLLLGALVAFMIFRRIRRNFGRQLVSRGRLIFRVVVFVLLGSVILLFSARDPRLLGSVVGGLAAGLILGYLGLKYTIFEVTDRGRFYTPHTYIGLLVTALFLGRIVFRYLSATVNPQTMAGAAQNPFLAYQRNPLTLAVFGVLVGYYLYFNLGVLRRSAELPLQTSAQPPVA